jgi:hypothetical protein
MPFGKSSIRTRGGSDLRRARNLLAWLARRARNASRGETGSSLVESSLCLMIAFCMMFGLIEVSLACYAREYISEVAYEGTRYAMVRGSTCETSLGASCTTTTTAVSTYVSSGTGLPNLAGGAMTVTTTFPDGNESPGSRVKIAISYAFPYHIPLVTRSTLTMTTASEVYFVQ